MNKLYLNEIKIIENKPEIGISGTGRLGFPLCATIACKGYLSPCAQESFHYSCSYLTINLYNHNEEEDEKGRCRDKPVPQNPVFHLIIGLDTFMVLIL